MNIIYFKNFYKKTNSTKRPIDNQGTSVSVELKTPTSLESPVFIMSMTSDFESINYIKALNHYYTVNDIVILDNNRIELQCTQDVLATYKNDILNYSAYVERSQSLYDTSIADNYVTIHNAESISDSVVSVGTLFNSVGVYVISVLNDVGSGAGFTTYYVVDASTLQSLAQYCNQNLGSESTTFLEWVQATFLKTADAIIDCKWLPISLQALAGVGGLVGEPIKVGKDQLSITGSRFTGTVVIDKTFSVNVPHIYTDFRKASPFTKAFLFLPFYSTYQFNPIDFNTIKVRYNIDLATGDTIVYLSNEDNTLITTITYNIAVISPVGKVGNDATGVITSVIGGVGSVASAVLTGGAGSVVAGTLGATASSINAISSASSISPSVRGSQGGRAMTENGLDIHIIMIANDTSNPADLTSIVGRPLMSQVRLSSLTGYVQTSSASINIAGRTDDSTRINRLLDTGIYLE